MPFFTKKPVTIEAVQYVRYNVDEVCDFVSAGGQLVRLGHVDPASGVELHILTLEDGINGEARHVASPGDWIIKGVKGEFYPVKPDIFEATYDPATPKDPS